MTTGVLTSRCSITYSKKNSSCQTPSLVNLNITSTYNIVWYKQVGKEEKEVEMQGLMLW